jgi:hypothetical protein
MFAAGSVLHVATYDNPSILTLVAGGLIGLPLAVRLAGFIDGKLYRMLLVFAVLAVYEHVLTLIGGLA